MQVEMTQYDRTVLTLDTYVSFTRTAVCVISVEVTVLGTDTSIL